MGFTISMGPLTERVEQNVPFLRSEKSRFCNLVENQTFLASEVGGDFSTADTVIFHSLA